MQNVEAISEAMYNYYVWGPPNFEKGGLEEKHLGEEAVLAFQSEPSEMLEEWFGEHIMISHEHRRHPILGHETTTQIVLPESAIFIPVLLQTFTTSKVSHLIGKAMDSYEPRGVVYSWRHKPFTLPS